MRKAESLRFKLIDRALHDVAGESEEMDDVDCAALRPLALKLAKVYKPCALVVKKTELMEGVADTHGIILGPGEKRILLTGWYEYCTSWVPGLCWGRYPAQETCVT